MKNKGMMCLRCESVGRKPKEAIHKVQINNTVEFVCDECKDELDDEINLMYEIKEDEDTP